VGVLSPVAGDNFPNGDIEPSSKSPAAFPNRAVIPDPKMSAPAEALVELLGISMHFPTEQQTSESITARTLPAGHATVANLKQLVLSH